MDIIGPKTSFGRRTVARSRASDRDGRCFAPRHRPSGTIRAAAPSINETTALRRGESATESPLRRRTQWTPSFEIAGSRRSRRRYVAALPTLPDMKIGRSTETATRPKPAEVSRVSGEDLRPLAPSNTRGQADRLRKRSREPLSRNFVTEHERRPLRLGMRDGFECIMTTMNRALTPCAKFR
jgi:hypothetical protein